ncbi:hypothetical protein LINPERHAP1_LOCUS691, partial [Linum perenne]
MYGCCCCSSEMFGLDFLTFFFWKVSSSLCCGLNNFGGDD